MSKRMQRIAAGALAVCLCLLGAAAGWTLSGGGGDVSAAKSTKVDGMIFWGTSGLARMHELITDDTQYQSFTGESNRSSKAEAGQHEWVGLEGYEGQPLLNYGKFAGGYGTGELSSYAILKDWYPSWSADNDVTQNLGGRSAQYWKFDEDATAENPHREPTAVTGNDLANPGKLIMAALDKVTTTGHVNPATGGAAEVWGQDEEENGGNGNDQKGDGIAIVIWAGEDWVVRNWDSSDLGFVGREDGELSSTMDTDSTVGILLRYWMGLDCEDFGGTSTHSYNPASWGNPIDDGSVMHTVTKDDGISGDENGSWGGGGSFTGNAGTGDPLQAVNGHVGDQEVAVYTCNDALYPNIDKSIRLNDVTAYAELDKGTDNKGTVGSALVTSPYDGNYAYTDTSDGGTKTQPGSSQQDKTIQPAGNSRQVSHRYETQWVEQDNGYHDYEQSGFSYNGIDDGINVDLTQHALSSTTDPIGDGYANGRKDSLATQVGVLFARILSGYDYQVEYLVQDTDASAIPHNTDDTQLDDWYEVTYLSLKEVPCSHGPGCCADNCEAYIYCNHNEHWEVSVQMIRVRSRCDTRTGVGSDKLANQEAGTANAGYADSYHIHVLGGVGMYDVFPVDGDLYDIPTDEYTTGHKTNANCGTPARGFTDDYDGREDNGSVDGTPYESHSTADAEGSSHNCWEHIPTGGYANDNNDLTGLGNAYPDQPSVPDVPYMPQKLKDESEQNGVFSGGFDWPCSHSPITGDHDGICLRDRGGHCCCCNHSSIPPYHCNSDCRHYDKSRLCAYLRVMPVIEVPGFDGKTHNVIPTSVMAWDGSGYVNLNDQDLQFYQAAYAAAAQRYLRTWGDDLGTRRWQEKINPTVVTYETSTYKSGDYPWGMIKYEVSSNPPSNTMATEPVSGTQYQSGSNFVNHKQDSHVYIRTWYTNPNKPIMKYVTETRHVNGYIETWKDKYPDIKVYVFGLGPYSKSTTEDTMDTVWTSSRSITDASYWTEEFGRDTNYDGKIDGLDRVSTNNEGSLDASQLYDEMPYTTLSDEPRKGYYTDTEGMWGSTDPIEIRNNELKHRYLVTDPYFSADDGRGHTVTRDTVPVAYADDTAVKEHLKQLYPNLVIKGTDAAGNETEDTHLIDDLFRKMTEGSDPWIRKVNGKYYADGSWLDLEEYGGSLDAKDKYLDEIERTNRIENARKQYNDAVKSNLKGATFVDIWDLTLEHNPYFQYGSLVDSADVSSAGAGGGSAVNAYHGKYYDQTTYSWIFHMMWSTVLNDNPEDEPDEVISANLYDLSAALTAYANTVLSAKGRSNTGGGTDGSQAAITTDSDDDVSHKLPDLASVGFFGAGAALGYGDTAYGFTPAVVVPISESSSSIDYSSLVKAEMGTDSGEPTNSAMYIYARYGHLLQDMGLDETGVESTVSPRMTTGLITSVGYLGNAALGVVWNTAFEILDALNPFRFLIGTGTPTDGVAIGHGNDAATGTEMTDAWGGTEVVSLTTGEDTAQQIEGLSNSDGVVVKAMTPLINYITGIYLVMRGIGLWIVLPLMLALFFASVFMLRKKWSQEAMKLAVPLVFISIGVPLLGGMYTAVLTECRELVNMSASPSSQLVAATFVDFEGWVKQSRLAPPVDASGGGASVEFVSAGTGDSDAAMTVSASPAGYASGESLKNLRKIAWSINKSTNVIPAMRDESSVYNDVQVADLDDGGYWSTLVNGQYAGMTERTSYDGSGSRDWIKDWRDSMAASREIMAMLWKYTNGDFYFASTFNSDTMAHFSKYHPTLIGSRRGASSDTASSSASDADEFTADGVPTGATGSDYSELENKYKLYGLFASASHGDDWLNRTSVENQSLLMGLDETLMKDTASGEAYTDAEGGTHSENFTGFNPFANGRITATAVSGSVPANESTVIKYTRDMAATEFESSPYVTAGDGSYVTDADGNPQANKAWDEHSGLDWSTNGGLSTVAMYNYLASDFDSASVKTYSSRNVINMHQERAHYAVNVVGSGGTGTVYWLSCVVYMLYCCVIGFIYALGMVIQNIKNGMQMIMTLPAAMLGVRKSIVGVCALVVSLIFQIVSSVALYYVVAQILMVLVTLMDTISRTSFGNLTLSADVGGLLASYGNMLDPAALQGSFASQLLYMSGIAVLMAAMTWAACYMAPALMRINDMAFDWFMVKFVMPEHAMGGYLRMKAEARARKAGRARGRVRARRRVRDLIPVENTACEKTGQGV